MRPVSKAQKARLGIFLAVAMTLLFGTLVVVVGLAALEQRDQYVIRFSGSISGLEQGSQVRYNGIRVGRVETIRIAPDDISEVEVTITLDGGTPIKADTEAVLNMQGITGLKYIELSGGTDDAKVLEPGSEIQAGASSFDDITEKAMNIATKIEVLLDNLVLFTGPDNQEKFARILEEVEANLVAVRTLLQSEDIRTTLGNVSDASANVVSITKNVDETVLLAKDTLTDVRSGLDPVLIRRILGKAVAVLDELKARLSKDELGATMASAKTLMDQSTELVDNVNVTVLRTRDDLRRILDVVLTGGENLADFTQILVDNPSALISGRSANERVIP